jgi:hypothetical protein
MTQHLPATLFFFRALTDCIIPGASIAPRMDERMFNNSYLKIGKTPKQKYAYFRHNNAYCRIFLQRIDEPWCELAEFWISSTPEGL